MFIVDVLNGIGIFYVNFYKRIGLNGRRTNGPSDQGEDKIYFFGLMGCRTNGHRINGSSVRRELFVGPTSRRIIGPSDGCRTTICGPKDQWIIGLMKNSHVLLVLFAATRNTCSYAWSVA